MSDTIHETDLWFTAGASDKEYHASIVREPNGFSVHFTYGRRGSASKSGLKCSGETYDKARKVYVSLVKSKMKKGYVPNESGQPMSDDMDLSEFEVSVPVSPDGPWVKALGAPKKVSPQHSKPKKKNRPIPQLLNMIEEDDMLALLKDPAWGAQEKIDGKRITLEYDTAHLGTLKAFNKKGEECLCPHVLVNELADLCHSNGLKKVLLDGELVGMTYHVFDILEYRDESVHYDCRGDGYQDRYHILNTFLKNTPNLKLVPLAITQAQKQALLKKLRKSGAEGIVLKRLKAAYTSGRPNSGGDQLKYKFYATASVIIHQVNTKNSVNMAVLDGDTKVSVGNCTIPAKVKKDLSAGIIIEVRYLYAYKGGSLYQPTYKGIRDDVDAEECVIDQLKYKGEGEEEPAPPATRKLILD